MNKGEFAQNDCDAIPRFIKYKEKDPFPSIPPALLNGADIADYVRATGMVVPFDVERIKSGSYGAKLLGKCYWWSEGEEKHEKALNKSTDRFELKPNSLVYVQVEPTFRLPDYIALRFNLKITHVHRGLLLGTGPLIDPGFEGKLLIPIHNFSNNSYVLKGEEELIWIEFTKLSPIHRYKEDEPIEVCTRDDLLQRKGVYKKFPDGKKRKAPDYYFDKATDRSRSAKPVFFSSVKEIHRKTSNKIKSFSGEIKKQNKKLNFIQWGGIASIIVAILTFGVPIFNLVNSVNYEQDLKWKDLINKTNKQHSNLDKLKNEIKTDQAKIAHLERELANITAKTSSRDSGVNRVNSVQSRTKPQSIK